MNQIPEYFKIYDYCNRPSYYKFKKIIENNILSCYSFKNIECMNDDFSFIFGFATVIYTENDKQIIPITKEEFMKAYHEIFSKIESKIIF